MCKTLIRKIISRGTSIYSFVTAGLLFLGTACAVDGVEEGIDSQGIKAVQKEDGTTAESLGGGACYIEYCCPTNDFDIIGWKYGSPSIGSAYKLCDAACDVTCVSSGLICY